MSIPKDKSEFVQLVQEVDSLIRQAQHGKARELLTHSQFNNVDREQAYQLADLARRVNVPGITIRLLKPFIFEEYPGTPAATSKEKALYATALSRLGVFHEAQKLLKATDTDEAPEALLYQGFHYKIQWDDISAASQFKKFIKRADISDYLKIVGKVNLASCLVSQMTWKESDLLLEEIRAEIESVAADADGLSENFHLLYANSLELSAHSAILQRQYLEAQKLIHKGERYLIGTKSRYEMILKKWKTIAEILLAPNDQSKLDAFLFMKEESRKARNWETFRDFDFFQALIQRDDNRFLKVYHGTPYTSFRRRLRSVYKPEFSIPKAYDWDVNLELAQSGRQEQVGVGVFDLRKGCQPGGSSSLTSQMLLLKLLRTLSRDFYRPVAMGHLISTLYPDEIYNPISSPEKANQAVKRLRKWLGENEIPLQINLNDDQFSLQAISPYIIRMTLETVSEVTKNDSILESVRSQFSENHFTSKDIVEALGLSQDAVRNFIRWALDRKKINQTAAGRSSRYRLSRSALNF